MRQFRFALAMLVIGMMSTEARAQWNNPYGAGNPQGMTQPGQFFAPNYYNRANQPLSPYLNLLRPNNPAVNFYYGVRPGLPSGGAVPAATTPNFNPFAPRTGFVQSMERLDYSGTDESGFPIAGVAPTGHPVQYGNLSNYGNLNGGMMNRGGMQSQGGSRMMGVGATPAPPPQPPKK